MTQHAIDDPAGAARALLEETLLRFRDPETGDFWEHQPPIPGDPTVAFLWPLSALLSAWIAVLRLDPDIDWTRLRDPAGDESSLQGFSDLLDRIETYRDETRTPAAYQVQPTRLGPTERFYDDNAWLGLDFLRLWTLSGDPRTLARARDIAAFLLDGLSDELGGGVYWCEQTRDMKNTCSNAPTALLLLRLAMETGETMYEQKALSILGWTKSALQAPDGLYFDHLTVDGRLDERRFAYNTGVMIQCSVCLYGNTLDRTLLVEAMRMADAAKSRFIRIREDGLPGYDRETAWFTAVFARACLDLGRWTGDLSPVRFIGDDFRKNRYFGWRPDWLLDRAARIEGLALAALASQVQADRTEHKERFHDDDRA